ncbi:MAG: MFS transporter [Clostridia bacterium]|nr:MFS transporter [Clostridia bacterium]
MKTGDDYRLTLRVCFVTFVVQAVIVNFAPLLFVEWGAQFGLPLGKVTALITFNFGIQLLTDLASAFFVDRLGYRRSMFAAHVFCAAGLVSLATLPFVLPDSYAGLFVATGLYGIGGGLIEVLVSPIVEACPTDNKETAMSLLHSFYSWGQAAVTLLTTAFFAIFGIERWRLLAVIWGLLPLGNMIVLFFAPMPPLIRAEENGKGGFAAIFRTPFFWLSVLMMICAGGSEQAISQWSSSFAERGLGVSKTAGDLLGPMLFAVMMAVARTAFGKFGHKLELRKIMLASSVLCVACYLVAALSEMPLLSLVACGMTGLACGIFWPGTLSISAASVKNGGNRMFSLLALAGDIGCNLGPTFAGAVASAKGDDLGAGILAAVVLPCMMTVCIIVAFGRNSIANQAKKK